jgi:hypothetical protein
MNTVYAVIVDNYTAFATLCSFHWLFRRRFSFALLPKLIPANQVRELTPTIARPSMANCLGKDKPKGSGVPPKATATSLGAPGLPQAWFRHDWL